MAQFEKDSFIGKDAEYEIPTKRKESRLQRLGKNLKLRSKLMLECSMLIGLTVFQPFKLKNRSPLKIKAKVSCLEFLKSNCLRYSCAPLN